MRLTHKNTNFLWGPNIQSGVQDYQYTRPKQCARARASPVFSYGEWGAIVGMPSRRAPLPPHARRASCVFDANPCRRALRDSPRAFVCFAATPPLNAAHSQEHGGEWHGRGGAAGAARTAGAAGAARGERPVPVTQVPPFCFRCANCARRHTIFCPKSCSTVRNRISHFMKVLTAQVRIFEFSIKEDCKTWYVARTAKPELWPGFVQNLKLVFVPGFTVGNPNLSG